MGKTLKNNLFLVLFKLILVLILFCVFTPNTKAANYVANYGYTGKEEVFEAPYGGWYELQVWGGQGGYGLCNGSKCGGGYGYGGYAQGAIFLKKGEKLYINVGGRGTNGTYRVNSAGGYNGGGNGSWDGSDDESSGGGGGATHIATASGLLKNLVNNKESVIIVAGGGGGSSWSSTAGSGGGYKGSSKQTSTKEVSQTTGYQFGQGQNGSGAADSDGVGGGGGGWYGGYMNNVGGSSSGQGGSGYIASSKLIDYGSVKRQMYCYNCPTSSEATTLTYSVTTSNATATANTPKIDAGYARITLLQVANTNAKLNYMTITGGPMTWDETFTPDNTSYNVNVDSEVKTVTIQSTPQETTTLVVPDVLNYDVPVGTSEVSISTTAQSGDTMVYKVKFTRTASSYKYLDDILINDDSIADFNPTTLTYNITIPYNVDSATIEGIRARTNQKVTSKTKLKLDTGYNYYEINVEAEDKSSQSTYKLNITREHSSYLSKLNLGEYKLNPTFDPETLTYDIEMLNSDVNMDVFAEAFDEEAKITISGDKFIVNPTGQITILVEEPNVLPTTYTINYKKIAFTSIPGYTCKKAYEKYTIPYTAEYKLEVWGAQGGGSQINGNTNLGVGGKGGYSTGTLKLKQGTELYIFTGCAGGTSNGGLASGGWNGGGASWATNSADPAGGGGGASDIRINGTTLYDRVIVAGGGGGGGEDSEVGAVGGGTAGAGSYPGKVNGTSGGATFGLGANTPRDGGGGGGGWYGGGTAGGSQTIPTSNSTDDTNGGSGGSGFIWTSANAANVTTGYKLTSEYYLSSASTIAGNASMPNKSGTGNVTGNEGDGYVKITPIIKSKNNYLMNITTSVGTLDPTFEPQIEDYEVVLDKYISSIDINATVSDPTAKVTGTGTYEVELGETKYIELTVTAANGDLRIYTVAVTRQALAKGEHSTKIAKLTLAGGEYDTEPKFSSEVLEYTIEIPDNVITIPVETLLYDKESTATVTGNGYIKNGKNGLITISVTSPYDIAPTTYKIKVTREGAPEDNTTDYGYTGEEVVFIAPQSGYYKLESWGAQGGYGLCQGSRCGGAYGYGGYATGAIKLKKGDKLYINVGGKGADGKYRVNPAGGYNGGGSGSWDSSDDESSGGGGGATSIALSSGLLSTFSNKRDEVVMVAGGGGGSSWYYTAGAGGGYKGGTQQTSTKEVSQTTGYAFGQGQNGVGRADSDGVGGGGGGWYGGYMNNVSYKSSGQGGSGYIAYTGLVSYRETLKSMYCYNCAESTAENTYTVSTQKNSAIPTSNYAKSGDGYVRITKLEDPSTNNFLSIITAETIDYQTEEVTPQPLDKAFDMTIEDYYITVDSMQTRITLGARLEDSRASIEGTGTFDVLAGENIYEIKVTAESGDIKTYRVHVTRPADTNPFPNDITISGLVPSLCAANDAYCKQVNSDNIETRYDKDTHTYYVTVPSRIKQLYFNVTPGHPYQDIAGEGKVSLSGGENNFTITVKSEAAGEKEIDELTENVDYSKYNYVITRDMTGNTDLLVFDILNPTYNINYNPDITEYYMSVPNIIDRWQENESDEKVPLCIETSEPICLDNETLQFYIEPDDPEATYIIDGPAALDVGMNKINILVTAANGETKTYILNVYRERNENTYLFELKVMHGTDNYILKPEFNKINTGTYNVTVPNEVDNVDIIAVPEASTTKVVGAGNKTLVTTKANVYTITTTAQNGTIENYKISITREKNSNNNLSSIVVSTDDKTYDLDPIFDKDTLNYNVTVDEGVSTINITATPEVSTTTYKLLDNKTIKVGTNTKRVMAIAEDGSSKTYTITITRPANTNNNLLDLIVSNGSTNFTLTQLDEEDNVLGTGFDKEVTKYTLTVENDIKNVNVSATKENNQSTIKGTGTYSLVVGENIILVTVTSEAGEQKQYEIIINRKPNNNAYLKSITTSVGIIVPDFDKEELSYTINVEDNVDVFEVFAIADVSTTSINGTKTKLNTKLTNLTSGTTVLDLVTLAEDGVTTLTYKINIVKDKSENDNIEFLIMEEGKIFPEFNPNIIEYTAKVPYTVTQGTFHVELQDPNATYEILNNNFDVGENEVIIRVTSEKGKETGVYKDYKVIVTRQEPEASENFLLSLNVNPGTLDPEFDKNNQFYVVDVPYDTTTVTVTGVASSGATINGTGTYTLKVGHNVAAVTVTSIDGKKRDYQILINRAKSNEARLQQLVVKGASLSQSFNKDIYEYSLTTDATSLIFEKIVPVDKDATYEILNNVLETNSENNKVTIRVTAPNGIDTKDYVITVNKQPSSNYYLSSLEVEGYTINPVFNKNTSLYYLTVSKDTNTVNVIATAEEPNATITGTGTQNLSVGPNYINVVVTSELGSTRTYTILVTKEGDDNNYLKVLEVKNATSMTPDFDKEELEYTIEIPYEETSLDLNIEKEVETSSYQVLNNSNLKVGNNKVTIAVTAENGSVRNYILNVTRKEIVSALIENITFKNYELSPKFNSNITSYTLTVDYEIEKLDDLFMNVILLDKHATYVVSGDTTFEVGSNQIVIDVTASDGITKEQYVINVERQPFANTYLDYMYTDRGDLDPVFNKTTMKYNITVPFEVTSIELFGEPVDKSVTVKTIYKGTTTNIDITDNTLGLYNLETGDNEIEIVVTSTTGISRRYYVTITREKDNDNYLTSLVAKVGAMKYNISPEFDKTHYEYSVTVPEGTPSINLSGTLSSDKATVTGLGTTKLKAGENVITINVTAENGNIRTYTVTVTRIANDNNHLIELIPSSGTLQPSFGYNDTNYTLNLDSSVSFLYFDVITENDYATVTGNERQIVPDGTSTRTIVVKAENGDERTYTITINKERTDNANLASLSVKDYSFTDISGNPLAFDPDVTDYYIEVPNSKTTLQAKEVTATTEDPNSKITKPNLINLVTTSDNEYKVIVTAPDGSTTKVYTIHTKRQPSSDSLLASLKVNVGTLNETFNPNLYEYTWTVPKGSILTPASVTATAADPNASITKTPYLAVTKTGEDTYEVTVTSEDGTNTSIYKLTILLDLSVDTSLANIEVDRGYYEPTFDTDTHTYDVYEYIDETEVVVTATPNADTSTVTKGNGTVQLTSDLVTHEIEITAEDGSTDTYTLIIHRSIKRDKGLKNLNLNGLDINLQEGDEGYQDKLCIDDKCILEPQFDTEQLEYSIKVPYEYKNLDVLYELMNEQQKVKFKINGEYITKYELPLGNTTLLVEVYDGLNNLTRTYTLNIERCKSNNTFLKYLNIHNGLEETDEKYISYPLDPLFEKHNLEYTIYVDKDVNEVTIDAIPEEETSSIYINGYNYLLPGENIATVDVRAKDGSTRTYVIHIMKSAKYNSYIKNITVSTGVFWDLNPKFKPSTTNYTVKVPSSADKATIEAVPLDPTTVITGTGEYPLVTGSNTVTLTATAPGDGSITIYKINIIREATIDVNLKQLIINEGTLSPSFDKSIVKYDLTLLEDVDKLTIHAIPEDPEATVTIHGNENLITGDNIVSIIVQSKDKTATKTYQVIVNKLPSDNNNLSSIRVYDDDKDYTLNPTFKKDVNEYKVEVTSEVEYVYLDATPDNKFATIKGIGKEYINYGNNIKDITVTAESGDINIYHINIYRPYNLDLLSLSTDIGTWDKPFDPKETSYTITVPNDADEIEVFAQAVLNKVAIVGIGKHQISTGDNTIEVIVMTKDNDTKTYTLTVHREYNDNNYLESLNVSGIMTPSFDKETEEYTVDVRKNVTSLESIIAKPEVETSSVEILNNSGFTQSNNPNKVTIRVTSEKGTTRDYILNVMLRDDEFFSNRLIELNVNHGKLTPDFKPDINNYAVTVSNSISEIYITTKPENERSVVTGDGKVQLNIGRNEIPITVTAQDGSKNVYILVAYRNETNDATLKELKVTGFNFIPIFNKLEENYTMEVDGDVDSLDITAIPTDENSTVKITGNTNLVNGINTVNIIVTAPDKTTTKTYTIEVTKNLSKNNYLIDLNISDFPFTDEFAKTNQGPYVVNVPSTVNSININATPESKNATVSGDGVVKLNGGKNVLTVKVTAESGDIRDYTIIVNKALSSDNSLSNILLSDESLDPEFSPNTYKYTVKVPEELESITITGIPNDPSAKVVGNGTYNITEDFEVELKVTAEDGNTITYTVKIERDIPASSLLSSLVVKDGELYPAFHKLITSYTILVPNEIKSLNMIYTPEDPKATVTVTGNENFKIGTNKVHIIVTATDGGQTDYEIAVVRQQIASNYLKSLAVEGYTIHPAFDKTVMYYEVTVPEDVDKAKILATPEDPTSTISGTGYISLKTGTNRAYITVESASGVIRTYQVVINRTASSDNYLLSLESDIGTLDPVFDKDTHNYQLVVPEETEKVTLTGTASENSTISGLGTYEINIGSITKVITVTSQSGELNTYSIEIIRNAANNTNLIDLIPSTGTIEPEYSNDVTSYTMTVEDNINLISFAATPESKNATVTTDDILVLGYGENTYHVTVVAEDGITTRNIEIKITRNKDLISIDIDQEKIFIDIDEMKFLTYTINPLDTTYPEVEWTIDDPSIATIDENGKVVGVKYGSTIARLTSKHDSSVKDSVIVNVMSKKILSDIYDIHRNPINTPDKDKTLEYVIGIEPKTNITNFKANFLNNENMLFIYDQDDKLIEDNTSLVGTRFTIKLIYEEEVLDSLNIIVRGDLTSDGQINNTDYVKLKNYILKKVTFDEIDMLAGDLTQSGNILNTDYVKMKNYIMKKITSVN